MSNRTNPALPTTPSVSDVGFEILSFCDLYKKPCAIRQSSTVLHERPWASALWVGTQDNAMHLSLPQVQELIEHLQHWVGTGTLIPRETVLQMGTGDINV